MKRIILAALAVLCLGIRLQAGTGIPDISGESHPRLLADKKEFKEYAKAVKTARSVALVNLHKAQMAAADRFCEETEHAVYARDKSGIRILSVSRFALARIFACAYAYRFSGDRKYLDRAESLLLDVCSFPDWNPSHYLDTAEMSVAVAIGYDWLYSALKPGTRALIEKKLYAEALTGKDRDDYLGRRNNWNQVCNAGTVCAAIALYDIYPSVASVRIGESVDSNASVMDIMYAPDGIYPEGPSYWQYGTDFEILLITALRSAFGTDYGLSDKPGFRSSGRYILFSESGTGEHFNFYDNGPRAFTANEQWFFAWKNGSNDNLFYESRRCSSLETTSVANRLSPLFLLYAAKYDGKKVEEPVERVFSGKGTTPLAIARRGWGKDNAYLAVKAGKGGAPHGHLDAGSFVYDAYGYRWATEARYPKYEDTEFIFKKIGGDLWDYRPSSWRWNIPAYNNFSHNTLTVNGRYHNPDGRATLEEVIDTPSESGARIDITPALSPDLSKAVRTAVIDKNGTLLVTDSISVGKAAPAFIRWTMVTPAAVEVRDDCILLSQDGVTLKLTTDIADARYTVFSNSSAPSDNPLAELDRSEGTSICGFTFTVPRGRKVCLKTRAERISK